MIRLVALIGKKGSVFKATLQILRQIQLPVELVAAVTYREALRPDHHLPAESIIRWRYRNRRHFFSQLDRFLASQSTPPLLFSWFDRLVPDWFLQKYPLVNQHPSLLPAFPGMDAWQQALNKGVQVTGTTIHIVDEGVDTGPILLQHGMTLDPQRDLVRQRHCLFLLQVFQAVAFFYLLSQSDPMPTAESLPTFPYREIGPFDDVTQIGDYFQKCPSADPSCLAPWFQHVAGTTPPGLA